MKLLIVYILLVITSLLENEVISQIIVTDDEGYQGRPYSILDIHSSNKGVLFPTITSNTMNNLQTEYSVKENGLIVYCKDCDQTGFYIYQNRKWLYLFKNTNILISLDQLKTSKSLYSIGTLKNYFKNRAYNNNNNILRKIRLHDILKGNNSSAEGMRLTNLMTASDNIPNQLATKKYITDKTSFQNFSLEDFYDKDSINHFSKLYAKLDWITPDIDNSSSTASKISIPTVNYVNKALNNTFFFKETISKTNTSTNTPTIKLIDDSKVLYIGDSNSSSTIIRGATTFSNSLSFHREDNFTNLSETDFNNMPKFTVYDYDKNILTLKTDQFHINGDLIILDKNYFTIKGDANISGTIYCDSTLYIDKKTIINKKLHIRKELFIDKEAYFNKKIDAKNSIIINNSISLFKKKLKISNDLKLKKGIATLGNTTISKKSTLNNSGESIFNGSTVISDTLEMYTMNSLKSKFNVVNVSNDVNTFNNSESKTDTLIVGKSSNLSIVNIAKNITLETQMQINNTSQMNSLVVLGKMESELLDIKGDFNIKPYSKINGTTIVSNNLSTPTIKAYKTDVSGNTTINCPSTFKKSFTISAGQFTNHGNLTLSNLTVDNNIIVREQSNFIDNVNVYGSLNIFGNSTTPYSISGNVVTNHLSVSDGLTCKTIEINGDVTITKNLPLINLSKVTILKTNITNTNKLTVTNTAKFNTIKTQNTKINSNKLIIKDSLVAKGTTMIIKNNIFKWNKVQIKPTILNIYGNNNIDIGNHWIRGGNILTGIRIHPQGFTQIWTLDNISKSDYQDYKGGDLIVNQDVVVNGIFDYNENVFTIPDSISTQELKLSSNTSTILSHSHVGCDIETTFEDKYIRYPSLIAKNRIGIHKDKPICRLHIGGSQYGTMHNKYITFNYNEDKPRAIVEDIVAQTNDFLVYIKGMAYFDELSISKQVFIASDKRIKQLIGESDSRSDLLTLRDIEVVNYTKIDKIKNGSRIEKKVIAQQIESIYPQAVSTKRGFIPNMYKTADSIVLFKNNMIDIHIKNEFKIGDLVKIIIEEFDSSHVKIDQQSKTTVVEEVSQESFKIKLNNSYNKSDINSMIKIFVYGKEVDDLRSVDYDAISMLNVSATQELTKQLKRNDSILDIQEKWISEQNIMLQDEFKKNINKIKKLESIEEDILGKIIIIKSCKKEKK